MTTAIPQYPSSIRVAVGLWLATATFGVLNSAFYWSQFGTLQSALAERKVEAPTEAATALLTFHSITMGLFALIFVIFSLQLRKGRGWTRLVLTFGAVLELFFLLGQGITPEGLLVGVLVFGALLTTWWQTSTDWLAEVRAAR
ncbi:hypothetical protein JOF53_004885 [Crossiella equi]|uniref:DUF4345 domain-containing protein n=1 Tax=Crossiella equi TaxID=130796 RepID=A0ABS5AHG5_9PSEU|nr:hypothetical protein [Crossiella equi]MBP2476013.1 hypothetical protein [Crossiella equi]